MALRITYCRCCRPSLRRNVCRLLPSAAALVDALASRVFIAQRLADSGKLLLTLDGAAHSDIAVPGSSHD